MAHQTLTIANAKAECSKLGYMLRRDHEWNEFQVKVIGTRWDADATYHTDDLSDAVHTARAMHRAVWAQSAERIDRAIATRVREIIAVSFDCDAFRHPES